MISDDLRSIAERAREDRASPWLKQMQMLALYIVRRLGPSYFILARFWRKQIRFKEMLQHHSPTQYRTTIDALNPPRFQKLSQHKLVEKALLSTQGLPTPDFIGHIDGRRGCDHAGNLLVTEAHIEALLRRYSGSRLCFKKAEGSGGSGFLALDVVADSAGVTLTHPVSTERWSVSELARYLGTFPSGAIIEHYHNQHPLLSSLNPDSVNTLRIIVLNTPLGFEARGAMLRIGRKGSQIDNTFNGGLACPIDLETGVIKEALDLTPERRSHQSHPDSGTQIVGQQIPHWDACLNTACRALAAIPRMNFAGVDLAIGTHGPVVIEINVYPDRQFAAHIDLPHSILFASESGKTRGVSVR